MSSFSCITLEIEGPTITKACTTETNTMYINKFNIGSCFYYPLANEVAKGYSNATVRPSFRNILVNTLESTSFNGF